MPKPDKQIIIDEIIKGIEQLIPWVGEYLQTGNIYKVTPPDCANRVNAYGYYTYALIDPFNGEIFYIGKGKDGRAHQHFLDSQTNNKDKKDRIREIFKKGDKAIVWVLEHNLDEKKALDLEAVLINILPGLTNIMIPNLAKDNEWIIGSTDANQVMVDVECTEVDLSKCETMDMQEFIDYMTIIVCNGWRVDKKEHKYISRGQLYNFSSTIHLLPARLRNSKAIPFTDYIDKMMSNA